MIKFDFNSYTRSIISSDVLNNYIGCKDDVLKKIYDYEMTGWLNNFDSSILNDIYKIRDEVKNSSECLVVIGIGGSFMGSYSINEAMSDYFNDDKFPIIYVGNNLSSDYMSQLLKYLEGINFSLNVISKSGNTMEIITAYKLIKELMIKKYSNEELKKRIIITTDSNSGILREEVNKYGYLSFDIPKNIGGRYSLITAAHLFPLSFNNNIESLINGFNEGLKLKDDAFSYAINRRCLFDLKKYVEIFGVYEPKLNYYLEWLKQLFAETEGKDRKGIFPTSVIYTRDLHSLGQFIQDGNPITFETIIKVSDNPEILCDNLNLGDINNVVLESVADAHYDGGTACNIIEIDRIDEFNLGCLSAFFMLSAAFSAILFEVNPFDQPGVEVYKEYVNKNINKM